MEIKIPSVAGKTHCELPQSMAQINYFTGRGMVYKVHGNLCFFISIDSAGGYW